MRKEYDSSKSRPNPYAARLKRAVTIRLDEPTIAYFNALADEGRHWLSDVDQLVLARLCLLEATPDRSLGTIKRACLTSKCGRRAA